MTAMIQRYSEGPLPLWLYPVLLAGGALCFIPLNLPLNVVGAALVTGVVVFTSRRGRSQETGVVNAG
jgi:hypothetical protein